MKRNQIISKLLIFAGVLLLLGGVLLFLNNEFEDMQADKFQNESLDLIKEKIEAGVEPSDESSEDGIESSYTDIPVIEVDGSKYMGYLYVPSISKEFPVMADWSYPKLKKAVCRYYGSVATNDLVIAGHNFRKHFGQLKKLNVGEKVYFVSANGISYEYEIKEIEILEPTAISEMINSNYELSLYTCTYGGGERYTVRCKRIVENDG